MSRRSTGRHRKSHLPSRRTLSVVTGAVAVVAAVATGAVPLPRVEPGHAHVGDGRAVQTAQPVALYVGGGAPSAAVRHSGSGSGSGAVGAERSGAGSSPESPASAASPPSSPTASARPSVFAGAQGASPSPSTSSPAPSGGGSLPSLPLPLPRLPVPVPLPTETSTPLLPGVS